MAIVATAGETFTPAPEGVHQAVCVDVVDLGVLEVTFGQQTKRQHKVKIVWQTDESNEHERRFIVQKRYTLSLHEKATLRKELEAWRGKAFTAEELAGFDLEKLLGVNCQLSVVHAAREGKTYANVASIMPLGKKMIKIGPMEYVRMIDRTETDAPQNESMVNDDDIPF